MSLYMGNSFPAPDQSDHSICYNQDLKFYNIRSNFFSLGVKIDRIQQCHNLYQIIGVQH